MDEDDRRQAVFIRALNRPAAPLPPKPYIADPNETQPAPFIWTSFEVLHHVQITDEEAAEIQTLAEPWPFLIEWDAGRTLCDHILFRFSGTQATLEAEWRINGGWAYRIPVEIGLEPQDCEVAWNQARALGARGMVIRSEPRRVFYEQVKEARRKDAERTGRKATKTGTVGVLGYQRRWLWRKLDKHQIPWDPFPPTYEDLPPIRQKAVTKSHTRQKQGADNFGTGG